MIQTDSTPSPLFVVEGNIGAGKSTFLKMLEKYMHVQIILEPTDQWQNIDGENILDLFYKDPKRWAYTFQLYALITRIQTQKAYTYINHEPIQVLERSVYSDRFCFAKNCYEMGSLSLLEWKMYRKCFNWLVDTYVQKPAAFIYLKTDPEVCYNRIMRRNRSEESTISLDYLKLLDRRHEEWLVERKDLEACVEDIPVLILDNNYEFEHDVAVQKEHVKSIVTFIKKVSNLSDSKILLDGVVL